jgi:phosphoglycolate phosphatase
VLIGGDTCAERKPHPSAAAGGLPKPASVTPAQALYLGDDPRDIQAARAAGIRSVAVSLGLCR